MKICIFGLGRIGLPIALVCADSGYHVTGIDVNKELVAQLREKKIPFYEKGMEKLLKKHLNKNFIPKTPEENFQDEIKESEYIVFAVGTGFAKYPDKPKLNVLYSIIGQLISIGIKNKTLILRVTLPIGTSDDIIKLIEKKTGLKEGKDYSFGFVPERIMEGKAINEEKNLPKIVGCYNEKGFLKVSKFFKKIGGDIIKVKNPRTAEFIKLIDNSWRNTRFAFANELAFLAEENNIDVMESIKSANKGYKRNKIPTPGPVSGYCLGKDPYLLELAFKNIAEKRDFGSVWFTGRRANDWLNEKIAGEVKGKNILIAGLSFKENIDDYRYSHAVDMARMLVKKGYNVSATDPFLENNYYTRVPDDLKEKIKIHKDIKKALKQKNDTIIFTTRHDEYKTTEIKKMVKKIKQSKDAKIMDLWNMF